MNNACFISSDWFLFAFGMKVSPVKKSLTTNILRRNFLWYCDICFVFFCYLALFSHGGFDSKREENLNEFNFFHPVSLWIIFYSFFLFHGISTCIFHENTFHVLILNACKNVCFYRKILSQLILSCVLKLKVLENKNIKSKFLI